MSVEKEGLVKAKNYAYRLLNYRNWSVSEIEKRLAKKGFDEEVAAEVVDFLKANRLLDDYRFAKSFAEGRIRHRPSGLPLIRSRLFSKGISKDIIDSVVSDLESEYDEYAAAYKIACGKFKRSGGVSRVKAKRRIYDCLLRRRFKKDIIYRVLDNLFYDGR